MLSKLTNRLFLKSVDRSLRLKVSLGITVPLVLVSCIFAIIDYNRHQSVMLTNLSTMASYNGRLIVEAMQPAMLASDFVQMQRTLDLYGANRRFRTIYLLTASGKVAFAPQAKNLGVQLSNLDATCLPCHKLPPDKRPSGVVVNTVDGSRVFRSMQPIQNDPQCTRCHDPKQKLIGLLLTDISVAPFENAFVADLRENLILEGVTILLSVILVNLVIGRLVLRRLDKVAGALADFGSGKHSLRLAATSRDEIGQLEADFNQMSRQIQDEEAANRLLSENLHRQTSHQHDLLKCLITAQEDERKRVARELHDELGQALSGLALQSEVVERLILEHPERALRQISQSRELIGETTHKMYELILDLRPSALDDLGLVAALHAHADRVLTEKGIIFSLDSSGLKGRLPASIETTLYRIFQEAMSNVVKHSGANRVLIKLARNDGLFTGEIADNGHGFDPEAIDRCVDNPHGLGLLGMQERIAQCGGNLDLSSSPGNGTRIQIRVSLAEACDE